jgi:LEA14-like dessication related protein
MANKTIKMAAIAASVFAALSAGNVSAATFTLPASQSVSVEGTDKTGGANVALASSGAIAVKSSAGYADNDIVTFTLTNATWVNANEVALYSSAGNAAIPVGSTRLGGNASNVVSFRLASGTIGSGTEFVLGASENNNDAVGSVNISKIGSGAVATVAYAVTSGFGQSIDSASASNLFWGLREFSATDSNVAGAVSLTNSRLNFGGTTTPDLDTAGTVTLVENGTAPTNANVGLDAAGNDKFEITVTGDMTGISTINLYKNGDATDAKSAQAFTISGNSATISVNANHAQASGALAVNFIVDGTTELTARTFDVGAVLNLSDENDQTLLSATNDFGGFTVDSANAVVSAMSLNTSGFISWLKVVNESSVAATITGTATVTVGGTSMEVKDINLGTAAADAITTVSEATILTAIGQAAAEGTVDVSLNLSIDAPVDQVHVVAEKKASNGRLTSPVYYNNTKRDLFQ